MDEKDYFLTFWGYTLGTEEAEEAWRQKCEMMMRQNVQTHLISTDYQPYRSMVTGEVIQGRAQHREHMKKHGLVEIGNETKYLKPKEKTPDPRLKETLARVVYEKLRY